MNWLGHVREHRARTGSTMDDAFAHIEREGDKAHGYVVSADAQEAGRGQRGRRWEGSEKQLALSAVVRTARPMGERPLFALAAGLAISDLVFELGGHATIKWPNDVLIDDKKLAGVLVESRANGPLVIGVGLNIWRTDQIETLDASALRDVADLTRNEAFERLLYSLERRFDTLEQTGFDALRTPIRERLAWKGETVCCGPVRGTLRTLGDDGCIVLRNAEGEHRLRSGSLSRC